MATQSTVPPKTNGSLPRVDGPLKVSGAAKYSSDYNLAGMLYAVPVCATIASGKISYIRVALGGVGTKPWRSHEAEAALLHHAADGAAFHRAAAMAVRNARPQSENGFKVELTKRCIAQALTLATQTA